MDRPITDRPSGRSVRSWGGLLAQAPASILSRIARGRPSLFPGQDVNSFPANERTISEFERGRSSTAVVPVPTGLSVSAGDSVLFALAQSRADREPAYVKGGDSVRVLLTDVTDLKATDPGTGFALFQLTWAPIGRNGSPDAPTRSRRVKLS